jgi:hypothetical protein
MIKLILLMFYYLVVHPILIIGAINIVFPHAIPFTFLNILCISFIYNLIAERVNIRFGQ